jgi:hypothetical protein
MATQSALKDELVKIIGNIPDESSLPEAQYAFKQVMYFMALNILKAYPEAVIGPDPSRRGGGDPIGGGQPIEALGKFVNIIIDSDTGGGGPTGGGHINAILKLVTVILCLKAQDRKPPK